MSISADTLDAKVVELQAQVSRDCKVICCLMARLGVEKIELSMADVGGPGLDGSVWIGFDVEGDTDSGKPFTVRWFKGDAAKGMVEAIGKTVQ